MRCVLLILTLMWTSVALATDAVGTANGTGTGLAGDRASVESAAPGIPFKTSGASAEEQLSRVGTALILALAVGVLVIIGLKKVAGRSIGMTRNARMRQLETRRLGVRLTAHLVEVDAVTYLILHSGDQIQVVRHGGRETAAQTRLPENGSES